MANPAGAAWTPEEVWKVFDRQPSPHNKLDDISIEMHRSIAKDKAAAQNSGNFALYRSERIRLEGLRADEWAEKIVQACLEAWEDRGNRVCTALYRAIYSNLLVPLLAETFRRVTSDLTLEGLQADEVGGSAAKLAEFSREMRDKSALWRQKFQGPSSGGWSQTALFLEAQLAFLNSHKAREDYIEEEQRRAVLGSDPNDAERAAMNRLSTAQEQARRDLKLARQDEAWRLEAVKQDEAWRLEEDKWLEAAKQADAPRSTLPHLEAMVTYLNSPKAKSDFLKKEALRFAGAALGSGGGPRIPGGLMDSRETPEERATKRLRAAQESARRALEAAKQNEAQKQSECEAALRSVEVAAPLDALQKTVQPRTARISESSDSLSDSSDFSVGEDFRSIRWKGELYTLRSKQSQMFAVLHDAYRKGHPDVGKDRLLAAIENETSQVRDTWRKSKLWNTLVISSGKGIYRLDLEARASSAPNTAEIPG